MDLPVRSHCTVVYTPSAFTQLSRQTDGVCAGHWDDDECVNMFQAGWVDDRKYVFHETINTFSVTVLIFILAKSSPIMFRGKRAIQIALNSYSGGSKPLSRGFHLGRNLFLGGRGFRFNPQTKKSVLQQYYTSRPIPQENQWLGNMLFSNVIKN